MGPGLARTLRVRKMRLSELLLCTAVQAGQQRLCTVWRRACECGEKHTSPRAHLHTGIA